MNRYALKYNFTIDKVKGLLYRKNKGVRILDEDWDHLIILDACRYDMYQRAVGDGTAKLDGELEHRISRGSNTEEFLRENFDPTKKYNDIVYVTGNPHVDKIYKGCFHSIVPVWLDGWSDEHHTVMPEAMVEYALRASRDHPGKRLIIHFVQPHFPFIPLGSVGDLGMENFREAVMKGLKEFDNPTVWRLLEARQISLEDVKRSYFENLDVVLPHAEKLAKSLKGRIVLTSDHGNALGERFHWLLPIKVYGHHYNVYMESLVKVPWYVYESEGDDQTAVEVDRIHGRLADLMKGGRI